MKNVIKGVVFSLAYLAIAYLFFVAINGGCTWSRSSSGIDTTVEVLAVRAITSYAFMAFWVVFYKVMPYLDK